eukprot:2244540-Prymnesium_polylepis.1
MPLVCNSQVDCVAHAALVVLALLHQSTSSDESRVSRKHSPVARALGARSTASRPCDKCPIYVVDGSF